jgi:glycine/D-amino acid oxidase-like deaminating enzyme
MVLRSLRVFENFADAVGGSAGFIKTGFLMGVPERDRTALEKTIAMQRRVGINTSLITPDEIREIEPRARVNDLAAGAWSRIPAMPTLPIRPLPSCEERARWASAYSRTLRSSV